MVLLVEKLHKLYTKLENHHHHLQHEETLSRLFQGYRSDVSSSINQIASVPGSEFMSLSWFQQCFQILPIINKSFAKLVMAMDYPMTKWKSKSFEAYLNYSLELLELLNSVSCSISHLGQSRLLLSHALSLVESSTSSAVEKLRAVEFKNGSSNPKELKQDHNLVDVVKEVSSFNEDEVVDQALMELRSVGLWICSVVLSGLRGDAKAYMEIKTSDGFSANSSLTNLDCVIHEVMTEGGVVLKEVKELTGAADSLANELEIRKGGDVAEMQRKLEMFEKMVDELGKEVDCLFSQVLAGRNQLLSGIRLPKK